MIIKMIIAYNKVYLIAALYIYYIYYELAIQLQRIIVNILDGENKNLFYEKFFNET